MDLYLLELVTETKSTNERRQKPPTNITVLD